TQAAQQKLLSLIERPDSAFVDTTPTILSYMVVGGFLIILVTMMVGGLEFQNSSNSALVQIINICIGALAAGFATVLNFWLGSSLGSRKKDRTAAINSTLDRDAAATFKAPFSVNVKPSTSEEADGGLDDILKKKFSVIGIGPSTDPSTTNAQSDVPWKEGLEGFAATRYCNPGAQYPSTRAARFGQIGFGILKSAGGTFKIARFPSSVNGAAANFDLLSSSKYLGKTFGEIGQIWTGKLDFGVPGFNPDALLTNELLANPSTAIALMKAIAFREIGRASPVTDEDWLRAHEMFRLGSADAYLSKYGTTLAPIQTSVTSVPPQSLQNLIIDAMRRSNYSIDERNDYVNIVYIEGMNTDGTVNNDEANKFNDLRCAIVFADGVPRISVWEATTEPGNYYTVNPVNPKGAARIKFGQYKAWKVGMHRGHHEALVQCENLIVCRDLNGDMERKGDREEAGLFGINQHGGYDNPTDDIGRASAGCLVGRTMSGHKEFMDLVKQDPGFAQDKDKVFYTAVF
ncbi:MAG: hypothetical protein ACIWVG_10550, partial [Gloeotrichia echinulata HAB0833]